MIEYEKMSKEDLIELVGDKTEKIQNLEEKLDKSEQVSEKSPKNFGKRSPREDLTSNLEMVVNFDILHGSGEDYSKNGMGFVIQNDLEFEIRFDVDGELQDKTARLIWVKHIQEGGYKFGVEFIESQEKPAKEF